MAALALGALGTASASAAAPKNTVLPVVPSTTPHPGFIETTTTGTWTEKPTNYDYTWLRCNSSGSGCVAVSETTTTPSPYTVVTADIGYTLVSSVRAYNEFGMGTAQSKPTPVVVAPEIQHWYSETAGVWKKLTSGATQVALEGLPGKTPIEGFKPNPSMIFTSKFAGLPFQIACGSQTGTGSVENPSGGSAGTASGFAITLTNCRVPQPAAQECKFKGGKVWLNTLQGSALEFEGRPALKLNPAGTTTITTFTFEGCKSPGFNVSYEFTGSITGFVTPSQIEFTNTSSALFFGGQHVTLEGMAQIKAKPPFEYALKLAP